MLRQILEPRLLLALPGNHVSTSFKKPRPPALWQFTSVFADVTISLQCSFSGTQLLTNAQTVVGIVSLFNYHQISNGKTHSASLTSGRTVQTSLG